MSQDVYIRTKPNSVPKASKKLDFYQVLTGILLACFIFGHLLLVSSVLLGTNVFDGLAWILEELYIAQFILPAILLLVFAHFLIAARKMPFRQGEFVTFLSHARSMKHPETWAWLVQIVTAVIILALASTHIIEVMSDLPITAEKSAARMQEGSGAWFYISLLLCSWFHVGIGIFRMGVKYGYITIKNRKSVTKKILILICVCLILGFIAEIRYSTLALG